MPSLTNWFRSQPAPLIGLDIGASAIRLVELGLGRGGAPTLERCAHEPLERDWVIDGNIEQFDQVAAALRRLVKKSGTRTRQVAMALPAAAVITRKIALPANLPEPELEVQVEIEANQYIPFSLDEVSLDFCVIGPAPSGPHEVEVLIAASRREKVQDRQGLAEAAGLRPLIVDIESLAARRAAERLVDGLTGGPVMRSSPALVALFEIGDTTTSLQVLQGGDLIYERDQACGELQLIQQIVRQYGYSAQEAEQRLRSLELPADYPAQVLMPLTDMLSQELSRGLQFFFTSTPHHRVDHILLAGGAASLPGLVDAVAAQCAFPCSLANPFEGMGVAASVRERGLKREAAGFLTACGLALRRFTA